MKRLKLLLAALVPAIFLLTAFPEVTRNWQKALSPIASPSSWKRGEAPRHATSLRTLASDAADTLSLAALRDPFQGGPATASTFADTSPKPRAAHVGTAAPRLVSPRLPPPPRIQAVTGIVGTKVAVLRRRDGTTQVVQLGNRIDSSRVVAISSQGVQLEDRAGTYLLKAP